MIGKIICTATAAILIQAATHAGLELVPRPAEMELGQGSFRLDEDTRILHKGDGAKAVAEYLQAELQPATALPLKIGSIAWSKKNTILLSATAEQEGIGEEGYMLEVSPQRVIIRANTADGLFYGVQTLRQLLPAEIMGEEKAAGVEWTVPSVSIKDKPRFSWRGMHLDVARNFFPVEDVKSYIDLLAFYKMNVFHWHLTDDQGWRIEIKQYPRLTEVGSVRAESPQPGNRNQGDGEQYGPYFYTQEDIREIVSYAASRHIEVVPEIEMPGHALAALTAYPELGCTGGPYNVRTRWGIEPDIYCAGNEQVFEFLEDVLTETMELFPSKIIHIGGDEAPKQRWEKCPKCQARMKEEGLKNTHELQSYFIHRIDKFLNSKGRRIIGWDEILEGGLAPNASVMSWRGIDGGIAAARSGHDVVMSPTSHCYFDYYQSNDKQGEPEAIGGYLPLKRVYSYEPIPADLTEEQSRHILGAQGNIWTEYIRDYPHVEYMACPRMIALSEVVWSPKEARDYSDFIARLKPHLEHLDVAGVNYRGLDPEPIVVGKWKSGEPSEEWAVREWNIGRFLEGPGGYKVTFHYTGGSCRLDIRKAEIVVGGEVVSRDEHRATTGARNENNVFMLDLPRLPEGASVVLRSEIRSDGGRDSNGEILIYKD